MYIIHTQYSVCLTAQQLILTGVKDLQKAVSYTHLDVYKRQVHGRDNETYLHRTYEKNYNFAGTIFVDYENKGDFSDCNTIVYGHNMKNGSMFAQLKKFTQDEETYKKLSLIHI